MVIFVGRVFQIKPPQQGVGGKLGGTQQIAPAIGFGFGEAKEFLGPAARIAPDPSMNQGEQLRPSSDSIE